MAHGKIILQTKLRGEKACCPDNSFSGPANVHITCASLPFKHTFILLSADNTLNFVANGQANARIVKLDFFL
jgi:hypothetical protein